MIEARAIERQFDQLSSIVESEQIRRKDGCSYGPTQLSFAEGFILMVCKWGRSREESSVPAE
jgi:hypothetical protein